MDKLSFRHPSTEFYECLIMTECIALEVALLSRSSSIFQIAREGTDGHETLTSDNVLGNSAVLGGIEWALFTLG